MGSDVCQHLGGLGILSGVAEARYCGVGQQTHSNAVQCSSHLDYVGNGRPGGRTRRISVHCAERLLGLGARAQTLSPRPNAWPHTIDA